MTFFAWRSDHSSAGRYSAVALRTSQGSSCAGWPIRNDASTGITVSESTSEPDSAKTIVSATGLKSLPSSPCSVSSGRNTITMIAMPEATGSVTSRTAR